MKSPIPDLTWNDMERVEAFWRFSLAFYARPGVAAALLELQDRHGRDVNIVLWGVWVACCAGKRLSAEDFAAAAAAARERRDGAVEPLRALRRRLGSAPDPELREFRRPVGSLELIAERRVQARLARLGARCDDQPRSAGERLAAAAANLALYLGAEQAVSSQAEILRGAMAAFLKR